MSRTCFCRVTRFRGAHHYALPGRSEVQNRERFGESALPHDHDWALTLWLEGPLHEETGMIIDLVALDAVLEAQVRAPFHGQHINRVDDFFKTHQPTCEVLANYFYERLAPLVAPVSIARLRIAESDDIFAERVI